MTTTTNNELRLDGCAPEPLMAYLKALGILRLVAEQKDPAARGCWPNDQTFVLHSSLDRQALMDFFLKEYRPTPIVSPWNGGSGFYPRDNQAAISALGSWDDPRLKAYQDVIFAARDISIMGDLIAQFDQAERMADSRARRDARTEAGKARGQAKETILTECRNWMPEDAVSWLDAVYVLTSEGPRYPPLLGSGGNDGRLEFSNNFMDNLVQAFTGAEPGKRPPRRSDPEALRSEWLRAALFGDVSPTLTDNAIGQFNPGGVGGPNATTGFEGASLVNPWDYVLMIEGALFFAGAAARRLSAESRSRAVFPFTVETSAAGYGTAVDTEYTNDGSRAELWAPLWQQPATFEEISHVFGEGRAQLGKRQASTGTDFARAVVGLGIERGLSSFQRFGFLKRNGLAFIATPLGRFRATPKPEANLLFDLDPWLESLRRAAGNRNVPEGVSRALREIDRTILEFCAHGGSRRLQEALIAVGRAEQWLATSPNLRNRPRPLSGLSPEWLGACDDGSREFRLARALASIQGQGAVDSIRANLEPVVSRGDYWDWAEDSTSVVWHGGDTLQSMAAVLERRCLESHMKGTQGVTAGPGRGAGADLEEPPERRIHWNGLPLRGRAPATLADIHAFLQDSIDYRRMADLMLPLTAVRWRQSLPPLPRDGNSPPPTISRTYALLKLLLLPWDFHRHEGAERVPIRLEPSLISLLRAGRIEDAHRLAANRLWVSGAGRASIQMPNIPRDMLPRLAAALLFPVRHQDMYLLARYSLTQPADAVS